MTDYVHQAHHVEAPERYIPCTTRYRFFSCRATTGFARVETRNPNCSRFPVCKTLTKDDRTRNLPLIIHKSPLILHYTLFINNIDTDIGCNLCTITQNKQYTVLIKFRTNSYANFTRKHLGLMVPPISIQHNCKKTHYCLYNNSNAHSD